MDTFSGIFGGINFGLSDKLGNHVGHWLGVGVFGRSGELAYDISFGVLSFTRFVINLTELGVGGARTLVNLVGHRSGMRDGGRTSTGVVGSLVEAGFGIDDGIGFGHGEGVGDGFEVHLGKGALGILVSVGVGAFDGVWFGDGVGNVE